MKPLAATVTLPEPTADQREYIERLWSRPPYNPKAMIGAIALMLALSGCAELTAGKAIALDTGAKAADTALEDALLVKCRISTVGAVQRHYMANDQSWKLWTEECLGAGAIELPAGPINILPQ